jgi:hypothetical protein
VEERFAYRKPPIGRSSAAVVLNGDLRVEHQLLKAPLVVPMAEVASVVRVTEIDSDSAILRRDVRVLDLPSSALTESNVVVVLKAPVRVPRFKYGADHVLPITSRERKRGLDLDALGFTVEEPDGLTAALRRRGVRLAATVGSALREVVGDATPEEAARRRDERDRDRSKARRWLLVFGLVWTTALAARFALGAEGATLPASTVVGLILSSSPGPDWSRWRPRSSGARSVADGRFAIERAGGSSSASWLVSAPCSQSPSSWPARWPPISGRPACSPTGWWQGCRED